jgi:AcrR family transcriptional regulator
VAVSREQQILQASERLFFERSFDGVGVDDIGREIGLSGSAIYRSFGSKDEILAALFDQVIDGLLATLGPADADPFAELDRLVRGFLEFALRYDRLAAIWIREERSLSERHSREYARRRRRFTERWVDCLQRCYPDRATDELVSAARAVQLLLLSDAVRPPGGRRSSHVSPLLAEMALASLAVLGTAVELGAP